MANVKVVLTAIVMWLMTHPAAAQGLASFAGNWRGSATVVTGEGQQERFRCSANNSSQGNRLTVGLRCANQGGNFDLRAYFSQSGSSVTGTWEDRTYGNSGTLSGSASAGSMQFSMTGGAIAGQVTLFRSGNSLHLRGSFTSGIKTLTVAMSQ